MCLAIPMELIERGEYDGEVELNGVRRKVSLMLLPEAEVGEFLLIHAGYAIGKLDAEEAQETIALLEELARASEDAP
jgi:hydrogenase expression/formation protein HypC